MATKLKASASEELVRTAAAGFAWRQILPNVAGSEDRSEDNATTTILWAKGANISQIN
jgi:hypothetical protein